MNLKNVFFLLFFFILIIITSVLYYKTSITASRKILAKNLLQSIYNNELKKYDTNFNKTSIIDEYANEIFDILLKEKDTINTINKILNSDDLILLSYDKFINNAIQEGLDPNSEFIGSLYNEINNIKNTNDEYASKLYNENNIIFPFVIGPLYKIDTSTLITLKKIILEYINNNINNFINSFNTNTILINPKYNTFIDNYISSNLYDTFNEGKIKPFIIELIINEYKKNIEEIKKLLINNNNIIKNNLCTVLGGKIVDNKCTYSLEDCKQTFVDKSNNVFTDSINTKDLSTNIITAFNNNKCLLSAQSVLQKYVNSNISNYDISYNFENEKVNLTTEYCKKKGLETTTDLETKNLDCKLTKDKSMLESVFGKLLLDTIDKKYIGKNYEQCAIDEIDGAKTNIIPNNLNELIKPLTKKYGPIEKSLCFDKTIGCPTDKKLINGYCYNKCKDNYLQNPNKKNECYKLYATFENNGEFKNTDIITKKIIKYPYLPKNVCPAGYNYNVKEKKCIENCPNDYTYESNGRCMKNLPVRWDGAKEINSLKKNAIWSQSKVKVFKCSNPNKPELVDGLCYAKCPPGHVRVPGAPYTCRQEPCPEGYHKTGVNTCYRHPATTLAWKPKGLSIERWVCPAGHVNHSGTCWENNYDRGAGRPADLRPCESWMKDESGSCWARGCWWDWGLKCHCGCIKKWPHERVYCSRSGEVLRGLFCYPACAPGYEEATVTNCRFVGNYDGHGASCPSDRDTIDGRCYPKCEAGYYSSSPTTCETNNCPSGYYKTKLATCQLDAHTIPNPNIGAGETGLSCPDGTAEQNGICYPNNPPVGYHRHSISLEQWTEKCPDEWTDSGWNCTNRPYKTVKITDASCPAIYTDAGDNKCKRECEDGYDFLDEKCVQKCPDGIISSTETTCDREKEIVDFEEKKLPFNFRIKKKIE